MVIFCCALALGEKIADIHPENYVTDLAGVVEPETQARVDALAKEVEQKTGAQIAIVTVRSLEGQTVEDYAVDLFKHLGVGKKDNRGILLLIAPNDRKYRFEVGYGLEPVINDARAGDIGREMVPYLRRNDYSGAVELGASRVANLIAADSHVTLSSPQVSPVPQRQADPEINIPWWALPLGLFILFSIIRAVSRAGRGGRRGGRRGGGSGWWIGPMMGGGWGGGGGGWGGGGFGGSSGGFGGFGGGSSGGGGASGSW